MLAYLNQEIAMAFTPEAQTVWDSLDDSAREHLLAGSFCTRCLATQKYTLDAAEMRDGELALTGHCDVCGARVVKLARIGD